MAPMAQVTRARAETGDEHALRAGLAAVTGDIVKLRTKQVPLPLVGRQHAAPATGRSACPAARRPRPPQGMQGGISLCRAMLLQLLLQLWST